MTVEIHLSSAAVPVLAEPAEELLRVAANAEPKRRKLFHDEETSKGDPMAVAALILSIPGAIIAAMDLVDRAGVAERIRGLLKKVHEADGTASLHVGNEPSLDLKIATEDEVIDLIAKSRHP